MASCTRTNDNPWTGAPSGEMRGPQVKEGFAAAAIAPPGTRPEEFGNYIRAEVAMWGIKTAGLRPP
jgi:hypothetical protein